MEPNYNPYSFPNQKEVLPSSTAVLVLGILSIVLCWCCGLPGIIMGIISIVMGMQGRNLYKSNPEKYTQASYSNLSAGFICGIVGLALTILFLLFSVVNAMVNPSSSYKYQRFLESL